MKSNLILIAAGIGPTGDICPGGKDRLHVCTKAINEPRGERCTARLEDRCSLQKMSLSIFKEYTCLIMEDSTVPECSV